MTDNLVGIHEIAELLGVSRQRVDAISRTHDDFPAPVAELASGRIWKRQVIEEWARRNGRAQKQPDSRKRSRKGRRSTD
jgi:prophage regulatory protein